MQRNITMFDLISQAIEDGENDTAASLIQEGLDNMSAMMQRCVDNVAPQDYFLLAVSMRVASEQLTQGMPPEVRELTEILLRRVRGVTVVKRGK